MQCQTMSRWHRFVNHKHYGYRRPGQHWSERQKHERLFLTDEEMAELGAEGGSMARISAGRQSYQMAARIEEACNALPDVIELRDRCRDYLVRDICRIWATHAGSNYSKRKQAIAFRKNFDNLRSRCC